MAVSNVNEPLEVFWGAKASGNGEEKAHVITEAAIVRMLGDRHNLYAVVSKIFNAGNDIVYELLEGMNSRFQSRHSDVRLIDF